MEDNTQITPVADGAKQGEAGSSRDTLISRLNYVPYHSWVSLEDHERDRVAIETFLLESHLASADEIFEMKKTPLSVEEWRTIHDTPGHYWGKLFASRFPHKLMRIGHFNKFGYAPKGYLHFMKQQAAWNDADREMWAHGHSGEAMPDKVKKEHADQLSPEFRIFYVLETIALRREINYPWANQVWEKLHGRYVSQVSQKTDPAEALRGVPLC